GLSGTSDGFLQVVPLDTTRSCSCWEARRAYDIKDGVRRVAWGTTFPVVALLVLLVRAALSSNSQSEH
ncbi:hypothetical protein B0H12DRAFT_1016406, partial [Mycena haematopus]